MRLSGTRTAEESADYADVAVIRGGRKSVVHSVTRETRTVEESAYYADAALTGRYKRCGTPRPDTWISETLWPAARRVRTTIGVWLTFRLQANGRLWRLFPPPEYARTVEGGI